MFWNHLGRRSTSGRLLGNVSCFTIIDKIVKNFANFCTIVRQNSVDWNLNFQLDKEVQSTLWFYEIHVFSVSFSMIILTVNFYMFIHAIYNYIQNYIGNKCVQIPDSLFKFSTANIKPCCFITFSFLVLPFLGIGCLEIVLFR